MAILGNIGVFVDKFVIDVDFSRLFTVSARTFIHSHKLNQFHTHFPCQFRHIHIGFQPLDKFVHIVFVLGVISQLLFQSRSFFFQFRLFFAVLFKKSDTDVLRNMSGNLVFVHRRNDFSSSVNRAFICPRRFLFADCRSRCHTKKIVIFCSTHLEMTVIYHIEKRSNFKL